MVARGLMIAVVTGSIAFVLAPDRSLAQANNLQQAISHTRKAIQAGKQNNKAAFVQHADEAIDSATMAEQNNQNSTIKHGVTQLQKAVQAAQGSNRNVSAAVKRAETALGNFEAAK